MSADSFPEWFSFLYSEKRSAGPFSRTNCIITSDKEKPYEVRYIYSDLDNPSGHLHATRPQATNAGYHTATAHFKDRKNQGNPCNNYGAQTGNHEPVGLSIDEIY
jgi:hypothetical protein